MATRYGQARTRAARQAAKLARREQRTERRAADRAERDARREVVAKAGLRQSLGRPRTKHHPRQGKWTDYRDDFPRRVYRAILDGDIRSDPASIAEFFGVCQKTLDAWKRKHAAFARAVETSVVQRSALAMVGHLGRTARTHVDRSKLNPDAKTERGYFRGGTAIVCEPIRRRDIERFDRIRTKQHARRYLPMARAALAVQIRYAEDASDAQLAERLRRQLDEFGGVPVEAALVAVADGHLSNRQIAKALGIGESTWRGWLRLHPRAADVIAEAIARERERRADAESRARRAALPHHERHLAELADARARGLLAG